MRIRPLASVTVAVAALALTAGSALPASAADTVTTFELTGGSLSVSAPVTSDLGGGLAGGDAFDDQLGAVTVTDERGALSATWESLVFASDFTTGAETGAETIPAATNVEYWSGPATATAGVGTFVPGQPTAGDAQFLDGIVQGFRKSDGAGNNLATWNPTIIVTPPAGSVTGIYTGTVVHTFV